MLASVLYALSPLILRYSRSSWNPNPLPFFALLLVYFLYLGIKKQKFIYFLLAGAAFGISIQLHYLATILLAIAGAIIITNTNWRRWLLIFISATVGFLVTLSPFLLFEIKNGFPNMNTILEFVTRGTTVGYKTTNFVWMISNIGNIFLEELTKIKGTQFTVITFWALLLGGLFGLSKNFKGDKKLIFSSGLVWFLGGL